MKVVTIVDKMLQVKISKSEKWLLANAIQIVTISMKVITIAMKIVTSQNFKNYKMVTKFTSEIYIIKYIFILFDIINHFTSFEFYF